MSVSEKLLQMKRRELSYQVSLISYEGNGDESLQWTRWDNSYTVKALYRLGFSWPLISPEYLYNTLQMVDALDFFDEVE